jgi:hypothetical protein
MKISGYITISWAVLAIYCASAPAQESNGNPGPVDVSVHAGVEEQVQTEPSQGAARRPTTFGNWFSQGSSSHPAKPASSSTAPLGRAKGSNLADPPESNPKAPSSSFQPGRRQGTTVGPAPPRATDSASGKLRSQSGSFAIQPLKHVHDSPTRLKLSPPTLPASAPPETQGLPRPFEQEQSGQVFNPIRTHFSDGKGTKATRVKGHPTKAVNGLDKTNSSDSMIVSKP